MENRKKFSTGSWSNDNLQSRFEHVRAILSISSHLDRQELDFIIKNAFISKIYVSCGVVRAYPKSLPWFGKREKLYEQLVNNGILDLRDTLPNKLNGIYMDICELGTKVNSRVPNKKDLKKRIHIEHVVPGKVYLDDAIDLYQKKAFGKGEFKNIFDAVSICLVTEYENKQLNKWQNSMPIVNGAPVCYQKYPFARYDDVGVKIWKQCGQPCPGITNCP